MVRFRKPSTPMPKSISLLTTNEDRKIETGKTVATPTAPIMGPQRPPSVRRRSIRRIFTPSQKAAFSKLSGKEVSNNGPEIGAFDNSTEDAQAINTEGPLDAVVHLALLTESETPGFDSNPLLSAVHIISESYYKIPDEPRYEVQLGSYQRNNFSALKESLARLKENPLPLVVSVNIREPVSRVGKPKAEVTKVVSSVPWPSSASLEVRSDLAVIAATTDQRKSDLGSPSKWVVPEPPTTSENRSLMELIEHPPPRREPTKFVQVTKGSSNDISIDAGEFVAEGVTTQRIEQPPVAIQISKPMGIPNSEKSTPPDNKPRNKPEPNPPPNPNESAGILFGVLELDEGVDDWLENAKGHIELYLHPIGSRNPSDTIYLSDYVFPANEFKIDTKELRGAFRLMAGFYGNGMTDPVAQVPFRKTIDSSIQEKIRFRITTSSLETGKTTERNSPGGVTVVVTVFEGNTNGHQQSKPISNANVVVVGFPELGTFTTGPDGIARILGLPHRSEFPVSIGAPGYFSTQITVPTFDSKVEYSPVHLVPRDLVDTVTHYFTRVPHSVSKGTILGRIYDPISRAPLQGEQVSLSGRRGKALYFGALPDMSLTATTGIGIFGFMNVKPAHRFLRRDNKPPLVLQVRPDTAHFIEFARGGIGTLKGKVSDPFSNTWMSPKVSWVGYESLFTVPDSTGSFEFNNVDLPSGIVTLEAEAAGYHRTWFTIPWNLRQKESVRYLFMIEKDVMEESRKLAGAGFVSKSGAIVGGATGNIFKGKSCVIVKLFNSDGVEALSEKGPFAFTRALKNGESLCLTVQDPGFSFFNLKAGEYLLKWYNRGGRRVLRSRVVHVGEDRVTVITG